MAWTLDSKVGNFNVGSINATRRRRVKRQLKAQRKSRKERQADFADQVQSAIEAGIPVTIIPYVAPRERKGRKRDKIAELEAQIRDLKQSKYPDAPAYCKGMGKEFYLTREWRSLRFDVIRSSDGKCKLCGRSREDGIIIHVDHIKPRSKFPALELIFENLQVLCEDCNIGKSNK